MRHPRWSILCVALLLGCAASCAVRRGLESTSESSAGSGLVHVYLQPLDAEAGSLRAQFAGVAALTAEGTSRALQLETDALDGSQPQRQRLLAAGSLPAGTYRGLTFRIAAASLERNGVRSALTTDHEPILEEHPFTVEAGGARLLTLRLDPGRSVVEDVAFKPVFGIGTPSANALAPAAVALASVAGVDALVAFHKLTGEVFDLLRTAAGPQGVVYDAERRRAYVACAGADSVEAFDLLRGLREQSLPLQFADRPTGLTLSSDGRTLVVTNPGSNSLTVLDAPTLSQRYRLNVGREPVAAVFDSDERRLFVFQPSDDAISVVDPARGVVVATLATDAGPSFGALAGRGRRLVVIHRDSPYLTEVDLESLRVERGVYVGGGATAIAVDPRTDRIFLGRRGKRGIEVFNPGTGLPIDFLDTGSDVGFLKIADDAEQLYATLPALRQVRTLRLSGRSSTAATDVGGASPWVDVAGSGP